MQALDIRILIPGLSFDPADPFAKSLGGSETAGLQLAAALAAAGHVVTASANVPEQTSWRKVNIAPSSTFVSTQHGVPCDIAIAQRTPLAFANRSAAKVQMLWVHDLLFARRKNELNGVLHSLDRIITVSRWQAEQYRRVEPSLPERLFLPLRNGIDLELIAQAREAAPKRERDLILCTARPERGVDVLLNLIFPALLERIPNARLALAMYDVPNPQMEPFYQSLQAKAAGYGDRIEWHGALGKAALYRLMHRAGAYVYPTPSPGDPSFAETSCISLMEAMACGCPVIASSRGALPETVGEAGLLVEFDGPHAASEQAVNRFVNAIGEVLLKDHCFAALQVAGRKRTADLGWAPVAAAMVEEAQAILREQCRDPVRLARHFIRRQDIEAAKMVCLRAVTGKMYADAPANTLAELGEIQDRLERRYAHTSDYATLSAFYAKRLGPNNEHVFRMLMDSPPARFRDHCYVRFDMIVRMIETAIGHAASGPPNGKAQLRVLDFGCAQGEGPIVYANRLHAQVLGIDVSPDEVRRAGEIAAKHAEQPSDLAFHVASEDPATWEPMHEAVSEQGPFDILVVGEVIEHLINPVLTLQRLMELVRPGGTVVVTLPYGPWETQQPDALRGEHLREWDVADLRDVLKGKANLVIERVPLSTCPVSGEILGNAVVSFTVNHEPLGQIDWDRKLTTHRPRQTLSATMICGGERAHETLHWCLTSVRDVSDEIIIVDCGMTEEARRIAAQYDARLIPGEPPLKIGFAAARNIGLASCRGDWVLMIDTDERLCTGTTLSRYLRENVYHSYATPQMHFAIDAAWKPDLPGRVFRRGPGEDGRVLKFFGLLHEHAEFGINGGAGRAVALNDVVLAHVGYLTQQIRADRFMRNLPMLERDVSANPDRELGLLVVCRDSLIQAKWLLYRAGIDASQPGSALSDPLTKHLCTDVIGIWWNHFSRNGTVMGNEVAEQYHEACKMLGCDVISDGDTTSVQRQGVGASVTANAKFYAAIEHYERHIQTKLQAAVSPLSGEGF